MVMVMSHPLCETIHLPLFDRVFPFSFPFPFPVSSPWLDTISHLSRWRETFLTWTSHITDSIIIIIISQTLASRWDLGRQDAPRRDCYPSLKRDSIEPDSLVGKES